MSKERRIIVMNPQDYQRFVHKTELFTNANPSFKSTVRDQVQPNKDIPEGMAFINGKKVQVK